MTERGLVHLQGTAGNAAVSRLVAGDLPAVQRVQLNEQEERELASLKLTDAGWAKLARKRIEDFDSTDGLIWRRITYRPAEGVADAAWSGFLTEAFELLGKGKASLKKLRELRAERDAQWRRTARPSEGGRPGTRQEVPPSRQPRVTPEGLGEVKLRPVTRPSPAPAPTLGPKPLRPPRPGLPPPLVPPPTRVPGPTPAPTQVPRPLPPTPGRSPGPPISTTHTVTAPPRDQVTTGARRPPPQPSQPSQPSSGWATFSTADQAFMIRLLSDYRAGRLTEFRQVADRFRTSDTKRASPQPQGSDTAFLKDVDRLGLRRQGTSDTKLTTGGYPVDTQVGSANGSIKFRVYLNTVARHTPAVYGYVRDTIDTPRRVEGTRTSGVVFSKMGSHDIAATSRDVIVVYTTDQRAADDVLDELRRYQGVPGNPAHFGAEAVRMSEPAHGLRGVGVGQDPPTFDEWMKLADSYGKRQSEQWRAANLGPVEANLSFSEYRSAVIFAAIRDGAKASTDPLEQDAAVKTRLVEYFHLAGLDPANPSRQGKVTDQVISILEDFFFVSPDRSD